MTDNDDTGIFVTGTSGFRRNVVHSNAANQVLVAAQGAVASWDLGGTTGATCDPTTANTFACYTPNQPPVKYVGVMTVGASVIANGNSWKNATPQSSVDFASFSGGSFLPSPPIANCAASPIVCP